MFHKMASVYPVGKMRLLAFFTDGAARLYDMVPLVKRTATFKPLKENELFEQVCVDAGGYGISWSDDIDLSANEIYENGSQIDAAALGRQSLLRSIVAARKESGLSQLALQNASGVKQPVIARMESAATNPQLDTILKVLAPLGKTLTVTDIAEEVFDAAGSNGKLSDSQSKANKDSSSDGG